jgi:hypothetical protein
MIGLNISATQSRVAINVMRVPITEMLNIRMAAFYLPKYSLLMHSVLEEADGTALRAGTGLNYSGN